MSMLCDYTKSTEDQIQSNDRLKHHFHLEKKREQAWNKKYRNTPPFEFEKINWEENLDGKGFLLIKSEPLGKTKYSDTYQCKVKPCSFASNQVEQCFKEIAQDAEFSHYQKAKELSSTKTEIVACKIVRIKSLSKPLFSLYHKRNISIWHSLKHRSLVVIFKMFVTNALDKYYIFMDFGDQGNLTKYVRGQAPICGLPLNKSISFSINLLHGLHYLHSNGISHRRLKSDNCLICQNGNQLKITGLEYFLEICDVDHNGERSQCWMQHEHNGFNSIEAISNDPHNPFLEDIFGFGSLFYYMLADHTPFDACKLARDSNHNCREHRSSFKRHITNQTWTKRDAYKQKESEQIKALFINLFNLNTLIRPSTEELLMMDLFQVKK